MHYQRSEENKQALIINRLSGLVYKNFTILCGMDGI